MKRIISISILFATLLLFVSCNDFEGLVERVDTLEDKVAKLETLCNNMNTNISSLQTLIQALDAREYVDSILPVTEDGVVVGYTIKFAKQGDVTIYTSASASSPIIGAKEGADGKFYWTLYGEWITDADNHKIGIDVTPILKVNESLWYISWDNGVTWSALNIQIKDDHISFVNVETDEENAYFSLADGTTIVLPLASNNIAAKIQSISYIPRYSDGKVPVFPARSDSDSGYVALDFAVSPKSVISKLEEKWNEIVCVKAVSTIMRSVSYIDMPILDFEADVNNGIITVLASTTNISESFFSGTESANIALHITDGDYSVMSDYVNIYPTHTKIVAHRGYWNIEGGAQNSISGLLAADDIGTWGCEFDIWQTADGVIMLNHDNAINGVYIQSSNYSSLKDFTLPNGESYPLLRDYLMAYKEKCNKTKLILEIKQHYSDYRKARATRAAIAMIKELGLNDYVEYISFDQYSCDEVLKQNPDAKVAFLSSGFVDVAECARRGYAGIDLHYSVYQANPGLVEQAHELGLEVNAWTVNDEAAIRQMIDLGVDIITTDYPELAQSIILEKALSK